MAVSVSFCASESLASKPGAGTSSGVSTVVLKVSAAATGAVLVKLGMAVMRTRSSIRSTLFVEVDRSPKARVVVLLSAMKRWLLGVQTVVSRPVATVVSI